MHRGFMSDQQERERNVNKLADLRPDQNNARKHNPRNIGMVANSLREVGAARSGVIDEDGNILAGNGTYEALSEAGIEKVKIVQADGNEWVVVQRKGLSEKQKLKLALYDNRSAELAEWDKEVLADIDPEIMESMFSTDELEDLLDNEGGSEELEGEDDVPEAPEKAISQLGDLYQLGQHRLLCGDSTAQNAVNVLMDGQKADMVFTDPPYGMSYGGGRAKGSSPKGALVKAHGEIKGDDLRGDELIDMVRNALSLFAGNKKDGGGAYVCFTWRTYAEFEEAVRSVGLEPKACIVWDKKSIGLGNSNYRPQHEFIFYCDGQWYGNKAEADVWYMSRGSTGDYVHPTQKPVELIERAIGNSSKGGDIVIDPFGGSGSTLIASEKLNRKCYMMELDPQYCDVIVKRFNDLFPEIEILRNGEAFEPIHE
jgi:DNA modification methylase